MEYVIKFFQSFWDLANDMAIYILFGVFFAGVLKQIIPTGFVSKHLGHDSIGSVLKSSIFGIPLPLCSCSVIPFATTLKKEGASSGSVLSFLISTPITGVDSILATYGFFGWVFTTYRVVTSFVIAITAGILQNLFGSEVKEVVKEEEECSSCCCGSECESEKEPQKFSIKKVFEYAIFDIFADFAKPLFWGLVVGALITTFLPDNLMEYLGGKKWAVYGLILLVSMPMYICATASLPIAAGLIAAGISPGAAMVLLSAGPATNSVTMGVVGSLLGKRALIIYLTTIGVMSLIFGYLFDLYFGEVVTKESVAHAEHFGFFHMAAAVVMFVLMGYFLYKAYFTKKEESCCAVG